MKLGDCVTVSGRERELECVISDLTNEAKALRDEISRYKKALNIDIDGKIYIEKSTDDLPFGNACNSCALKDTACYDRLDINCHADSRPDRRDVFFVLADKQSQQTRGKK